MASGAMRGAATGWWRRHVRSLFIQVATTPNPSSLKFMPGRSLLSNGMTADFSNLRSAQASPLARALFQHPDVRNVLIASDFIAVTIGDAESWPRMKPEIFAALEDFFASGQPIISDANSSSAPNKDTTILDTDSDTVAMIKELIETRIRPYIQEDGGDVVYRGFVDGIVHLQLQGSCVGCPSSTVTLKNGIEGMLMHYCPEVKGVTEFVDEPLEAASREQLSKLEAELAAKNSTNQGNSS
ncbi:unnamed protein product (mitochondrion) [Plasmodiophora brassicae]|uniref:Scaffold protein Nfu/NifU N-terminal domain-containing protein n=1 Tax=Plasmodiophora brassicae TaxID=37360 RepID=A0A0G4IJQ9_PLABS|nr:hypothetical protein PBRA_004083 [Plasmodiophora brassicae]SPQ96236.1 unnamed protein product [Plasmodiophora brassicae]